MNTVSKGLFEKISRQKADISFVDFLYEADDIFYFGINNHVYGYSPDIEKPVFESYVRSIKDPVILLGFLVENAVLVDFERSNFDPLMESLYIGKKTSLRESEDEEDQPGDPEDEESDASEDEIDAEDEEFFSDEEGEEESEYSRAYGAAYTEGFEDAVSGKENRYEAETEDDENPDEESSDSEDTGGEESDEDSDDDELEESVSVKQEKYAHFFLTVSSESRSDIHRAYEVANHGMAINATSAIRKTPSGQWYSFLLRGVPASSFEEAKKKVAKEFENAGLSVTLSESAPKSVREGFVGSDQSAGGLGYGGLGEEQYPEEDLAVQPVYKESEEDESEVEPEDTEGDDFSDEDDSEESGEEEMSEAEMGARDGYEDGYADGLIFNRELQDGEDEVEEIESNEEEPEEEDAEEPVKESRKRPVKEAFEDDELEEDGDETVDLGDSDLDADDEAIMDMLSEQEAIEVFCDFLECDQYEIEASWEDERGDWHFVIDNQEYLVNQDREVLPQNGV